MKYLSWRQIVEYRGITENEDKENGLKLEKQRKKKIEHNSGDVYVNK